MHELRMATARPVVLPASQISRFPLSNLTRRDGRTAAEYLLKLSKKQKCPYPRAFIEVFEQGLRGVVLKVEDVDFVLELKVISLGVEVFHYSKALALIVAGIIRTVLTEDVNPLNLVKATVTRVQVEWVITCVDLCTLLMPGEGILV
ncbi:hypothetical protein IFM89_015958 [Coptis chinensis]|uniref:Uncharacterized protein n=1 Tax=Coptis chinensis TaxID=261450 RepID=A0A835LMQ6_9MAGN|nr:hypothetical protein IFM89_015958 [Coptis chinensis]